MIFTIAKMILIFIALAVAVIVISVVIWVVQGIIRWFRKERRKNGRSDKSSRH